MNESGKRLSYVEINTQIKVRPLVILYLPFSCFCMDHSKYFGSFRYFMILSNPFSVFRLNSLVFFKTDERPHFNGTTGKKYNKILHLS